MSIDGDLFHIDGVAVEPFYAVPDPLAPDGHRLVAARWATVRHVVWDVRVARAKVDQSAQRKTEFASRVVEAAGGDLDKPLWDIRDLAPPREPNVPGPKLAINGVAHSASSAGATGGNHRLSEDEGEKLSRYIAQANERAIRSTLGMTPELAAVLVARRDNLAPEVIERARRFLASL